MVRLLLKLTYYQLLIKYNYEKRKSEILSRKKQKKRHFQARLTNQHSPFRD